MLQQNKAQSNELVHRLGLPDVEHGLAAQLGYPLLVKPLDSGQGYGVSVNIQNAEQVAEAFGKVVKHSGTRKVIVERYIAGNDFQLMVTGDRFQWAIKSTPPEVTGDGSSSIAELIERKNAGLSYDLVKKGFAKPVVVDEELRRTLALSGLHLEDRLPASAIARLRSNANIFTGGSLIDLSGMIHPDNRPMAETIARAFRLDSVGIDFLTPDIVRSWRDVKCAVVKVNTTPGLISDEYAGLLLECKFPEGGNGRIPSSLVLCDTSVSRDQWFAAHAGCLPSMGTATRTGACLNGQQRRFANQTNAGAAAEALLLDPACESLVAICTLSEIRRRGLPLDRFDVDAWTTDAEPDPGLHELLKFACRTTVTISAELPAQALHDVLMHASKQSN